MEKKKKKIDIEVNTEEDNIYGNFVKKENEEIEQTEDSLKNNTKEKNNVISNINTKPNFDSDQNSYDNKFENEPYAYKEKEYNSNYLESHTVVTKASKISRAVLVGFYLLVIIVGVMIFFMLRQDKYEFYLVNDEVTISKGSNYQIELTPKNEQYFDYLNYNYEIQDESIAKVDEYGTVTAIAPGTTTLKISLSPGLTSKKMKIHTENIVIENISLLVYKDDKLQKNSTVTLSPNQSITLKAIVNNLDDSNISVNYQSSNTSVATVDDFGNVTAKKEGTATITGTRDGVEGKIVVNVKKTSSHQSSGQKPSTNTKPVTSKEVESLSFTSSNISLKKGNTTQLTVVVTPNELSNTSISYSSSASSIVSVNSNGIISGIKDGTATITATSSNGKKATCTVTVTDNTVNVSSIKLNATKGNVNVGNYYQLTATITPSNATVRNIVWKSSNSKIATVNNGLVRGLAEGVATISAETADGKIKATCTITVIKKNDTPTPSTPTPVNPTPSTPTPYEPQTNTTITVNRVYIDSASTVTKYVGDTLQLSKTISPSNATVKTTTWTSSNPSVATVSSTGLVRTIKKGTAIITVNVDGATDICTIIVKEKASVTPTPSTPTPSTPVNPTPVTPTPVNPTPSTPATPPQGSQISASGVSLSTTSLTVNKGSTATFSISVNNAAGMISISSSNSSVATVSSSSSDCFGSSCFFDNNSITFTVTGKSDGTAYINISLDDLVSYDENNLSGSGSVGILVK